MNVALELTMLLVDLICYWIDRPVTGVLVCMGIVVVVSVIITKKG